LGLFFFYSFFFSYSNGWTTWHPSLFTPFLLKFRDDALPAKADDTLSSSPDVGHHYGDRNQGYSFLTQQNHFFNPFKAKNT
jgi:hypothetical protein